MTRFAEAIHNGTTADNVQDTVNRRGNSRPARQPHHGCHQKRYSSHRRSKRAHRNRPSQRRYACEIHCSRNSTDADQRCQFRSSGITPTESAVAPVPRDQSLRPGYQLSEAEFRQRSPTSSRLRRRPRSHLRSLHSHQRPFARRPRPELQRWQSLRRPDVGRHRSPVHRRDARHAAAGPASHRGHGIRTDSVNRPNERCSPLRNRPRCNAGRDTTTRRSPARRHTDRSRDPRRIGSTGHADARRRLTH